MTNESTTTGIEWTSPAENIWIGTIRVMFRGPDGKPDRLRNLTFRIDARAGETYRVDILDYIIWTAIDRSSGFLSLNDAKTYVDEFVALCSAYQTTTPGTRELRARFAGVMEFGA